MIKLVTQVELVLIWLLFFCNSCSTNIDLEGVFEEQTIIYCLLDLSETDHYIRIQKSFIQEGISALELSMNSNLIYYDEDAINVYVEEWKNNIKQKSFAALRVNGDTMNIIKNPGEFAISPNILYHFNAELDSNALYKLFVVVSESQDTICAESNLVQQFKPISPTLYTINQNFADTGDVHYKCKYAVNGKIYELNMECYYTEKNIFTGDSVIKKLNWQIYNSIIAENLTGYGTIAYQLPQSTFFTFLKNNIEQDPEVIRTFLHINYIFYAGGVELFYNYVNGIATSGLLENYDIEFYSNISGGYGIFSSRYKVIVDSIILNSESIDSIACGISTNHLGFTSSKTNPYYPGCK